MDEGSHVAMNRFDIAADTAGYLSDRQLTLACHVVLDQQRSDFDFSSLIARVAAAEQHDQLDAVLMHVDADTNQTDQQYQRTMRELASRAFARWLTV